MVLGTGETGMDLAYEAAKAGAKEVTLCSRGGCEISCCIQKPILSSIEQIFIRPKSSRTSPRFNADV